MSYIRSVGEVRTGLVVARDRTCWVQDCDDAFKFEYASNLLRLGDRVLYHRTGDGIVSNIRPVIDTSRTVVKVRRRA